MSDSKEISPWEYWVVKNEPNGGISTSYDLLCDLAINSYGLDERRRHSNLKDMVQYFCLWWDFNRPKMRKYTTLESIGKALGIDHATVLHHIRRRKPTIDFDKNVSCLKDFLNS